MAKAKKVRLSSALKARLAGSIRQGRRETIYRMLKKKHGCAPCFVCETHVEPEHATLEHIIPLADGGTDAMDNLSISHSDCNKLRGRMPVGSPEFIALRFQMATKYTKSRGTTRSKSKNTAISR